MNTFFRSAMTAGLVLLATAGTAEAQLDLQDGDYAGEPKDYPMAEPDNENTVSLCNEACYHVPPPAIHDGLPVPSPQRKRFMPRRPTSVRRLFGKKKQ